jgi:hypothetical protein
MIQTLWVAGCNTAKWSSDNRLIVFDTIISDPNKHCTLYIVYSYTTKTEQVSKQVTLDIQESADHNSEEKHYYYLLALIPYRHYSGMFFCDISGIRVGGVANFENDLA